MKKLTWWSVTLCSHIQVCVCVYSVRWHLYGQRDTLTATLPFYVFGLQHAKWAHAGQKISKSNPHICWQTPDDQSSIRANTKRCKGCRSAFSASAWLPLRTGVSGGVDVVTLILCLANKRGRKLLQLAKSFMLWDIWLSLSRMLALLLNTNIGINFGYMLSAGNVI